MLNLGKKICDLALEHRNCGLQEINEFRVELLQHNEQVGANITEVRNEMSADQRAMQRDLNNMKAKLVKLEH